MNKRVIVIGASGHGKVIADIIIKSGDNLVGFLDDNPKGQSVLGFPILGKLKDIDRLCSGVEFVIAIGDNRLRRDISEHHDVPWYTAIHPSSAIALDVRIGAGTVIMAHTVINPSSQIGRHCIINSGAVIEHDNDLDDFVHICPHATLAGTVSIGQCTQIGAGATVKNNVSIGAQSTVGAGSVVIHNIQQEGVYIGVPARRIG